MNTHKSEEQLKLESQLRFQLWELEYYRTQRMLATCILGTVAFAIGMVIGKGLL